MNPRDRLSKPTFGIELAELPDNDTDGPDALYIREMNAADADAYDDSLREITHDGKGNVAVKPLVQNVHARLLVRCLCDQAGERIYRDDEADDLGQSLGRVLAHRLVDQAERLNGLDRERQKNLDRLSGNGTASRSASANGMLLPSAIS